MASIRNCQLSHSQRGFWCRSLEMSRRSGFASRALTLSHVSEQLVLDARAEDIPGQFAVKAKSVVKIETDDRLPKLVAIALECRTEGNRARRRYLRMQAKPRNISMKRLAPSGRLSIEGDAIAGNRAIDRRIVGAPNLTIERQ